VSSMLRATHFSSIVILGSVLLLSLPPAAAQETGATGTLCVVLYADLNQNGQRDAGETGLPDVNLSLAVASGAIITNAVTASSTPHCFQALPVQVHYQLRVDSPTYQQAGDAPFIFTLTPGERLEREVGVIARPILLAQSGPLVIPLTATSRLLLSSVCALAVMALMGGVGMAIYGTFLFPRRTTAERTQMIRTLTK
jgi:hypothetical protein